MADTFLQFDRTYARKQQLFAAEYVKTRLPWVLTNIVTPKSLKQRCVDAWQKYKKIKGIED